MYTKANRFACLGRLLISPSCSGLVRLPRQPRCPASLRGPHPVCAIRHAHRRIQPSRMPSSARRVAAPVRIVCPRSRRVASIACPRGSSMICDSEFAFGRSIYCLLVEPIAAAPSELSCRCRARRGAPSPASSNRARIGQRARSALSAAPGRGRRIADRVRARLRRRWSNRARCICSPGRSRASQQPSRPATCVWRCGA